jgi:hypothetical protein
MKTSQIVQNALRLYVAGSRRAGPRSEHGDKRFGQVLQGLVEGYKGERQRGYAAGLRAVEIIGFAGLDEFAGSEANFDLLFDSADETDFGWPGEDDYDDPTAFEADTEELKETMVRIEGSKAFRDGALEAFNDLWTGLQERIDADRNDELRRAAMELGIELNDAVTLLSAEYADEYLDPEAEADA